MSGTARSSMSSTRGSTAAAAAVTAAAPVLSALPAAEPERSELETYRRCAPRGY